MDPQTTQVTFFGALFGAVKLGVVLFILATFVGMGLALGYGVISGDTKPFRKAGELCGKAFGKLFGDKKKDEDDDDKVVELKPKKKTK